MIENYNFLFQYLEKEGITIDKFEFEFQVKSHPNYPSLLAISDTLLFFNIENIATRVGFLEIDTLPNRFIALLNNDESGSKFYFIESRGQYYFCNNGKKNEEITKDLLGKRWNDIVLLADKNEIENSIAIKKNDLFLVLPIITLSLFLIILFQIKDSLPLKFFMLLPIVGVLFSIAALKDLFGVKNKTINNFCNLTVSSSCSSVINSSKWGVFKYVKFADLSIVFFTSQLIGFLLLLSLGDVIAFLNFQKILLLVSLPIIAISIYYQKFVEKKWCPICLAIVSILLLEIVFLFFISFSTYSIVKQIIVFGFIFSFINLGWSLLRKTLLQLQELKSLQFESIRFARNYDVFKNTLLAKMKITLPESIFVLGNKESKTTITVITNPFCGHCKEVHEILDRILDRHHDLIRINVIIKTNFETENEDAKKMYRSLAKIYMENGEIAFRIALKKLFNNVKLEEWLSIYNLNIAATSFDENFDFCYKWCKENNYNFTPAIFINGYEYPQVYDRKNLEFFVSELIDDSNLN